MINEEALVMISKIVNLEGKVEPIRRAIIAAGMASSP